MSNIGSIRHVPTVSPVSFLPRFEKLGAKLTTPSWMSATGTGTGGTPVQLMFPRIFDNDAHRANLPNLPASHYSVLYSTDHALDPGVGYIGRVDFDDIEGEWTDSGAAIYSHADQAETPHPMYDPVNNRVNVYYHRATSTGPNATQASRLLTTTDLVTLTDVGDVMTYGQHTGYAQIWHDGGFKALHVMVGGEYFLNGYSTSSDGVNWTLSRMLMPQQNHCVGTSNLFGAEPFLFTWGGKTYMLSNLQTRPRFPTTAVIALVAYEIDPTTFRPIGAGFYMLLTPGESDYILNNHNSIVRLGNSLYLLYDARDADGNGAIHVAKSTLAGAGPTYFVYPAMADGELYRTATKTIRLDWNAVDDDLPATVIKAITTGTDTSAHQAGVGYKLSGTSTPDLWLHGDAVYDPTAFETLEFVVANLHYSGAGSGEFYLGFNNGTTSIANDAAYLKWASTAAGGGSVELLKAGVAQSFGAWTLPYFESSTVVRAWARTKAFTLAVRISNFGKRLSLLVDGHVTVSRDVEADGMTWTNDVRPFIEYKSGSELFFTRFTVNTYE